MGIFSSLITSNANRQAQKDANFANFRIAQMNNAYNLQMFNKQLQYNTDMFDKQADFSWKQAENANDFQEYMWSKNNTYNSASQQRARLEAAGLNPYLMMNGGSAGGASFSGGNMASTPSAMGVTPPRAEPFRVDPVMQDTRVSDSIFQLFEKLIQSRRLDADVSLIDEERKGKQIENRFKAMQLLADITDKIESSKGTRAKRLFQEIQNGFAGDMFQNEVNKGRQDYAIGQMQEQLMATDYMMKQIQLSALPYQIQGDLSEQLARIGLLSAQKGLTEEQTRKSAQDVLESIARTKGIKLSNNERKRCMDAVVSLAEAKAEEAHNNKYPRDSWQESFGSIGGTLYRRSKGVYEFLNPLSYIGK